MSDKPVYLLDATPVIYFAKIGKLELLSEICKPVIVDAVYREAASGDFPDSLHIRDLVDAGVLRVYRVEDRELVNRLQEASRRSWALFDLRGYARVDFRVDAGGTPWVLEVNANPCLSPDAGFAAAAERAGISYDRVIARILAAGG